MTSIRVLAKSLCPPILFETLAGASGRRLRFSSGVTTWQEAVSRTSGYGDPRILERVTRATREVVAGRAAYERDSVVFQESTVPYLIISALLRSALRDQGSLSVVDIGGSLGSTYRQCLDFLAPVRELRWNIVEQANFVEVGLREFCNEHLRFFELIDDIPLEATVPTFLLSSALQYLERPQDLVSELATRPGRHLIIDRTPMSDLDSHELCIQRAPRGVYEATYPCWILSRKLLTQALSERWRLICDEPSMEGAFKAKDGPRFEFRGLVFEAVR
jgi:putative methyltransferase (TIGR04325 family)